MIVATTDDLAIIGLSHKDLNELKDGCPIMLEDGFTKGLVPGRKIVIIAGTSEQTIVKALNSLMEIPTC